MKKYRLWFAKQALKNGLLNSLLAFKIFCTTFTYFDNLSEQSSDPVHDSPFSQEINSCLLQAFSDIHLQHLTDHVQSRKHTSEAQLHSQQKFTSSLKSIGNVCLEIPPPPVWFPVTLLLHQEHTKYIPEKKAADYQRW